MSAALKKSSIANAEFLMIEYKEASGNFFKGIDIGFNYSKSFLLLNGLLLAPFGLSQKVPIEGNAVVANLFFIAIAIFGVVSSFLLYCIVPYYERQLDNCVKRCIEIETEFEGKLYSTIFGTNSRQDRLITTTKTVRVITVMMGIIWALILIAKLIEI